MINTSIQKLKQHQSLMLDSAKSANWEQLDDLTAERQTLIESMLSNLNKSVLQNLLEIIQQEVQSIDDEISGLINQDKQSSINASAQLNKSFKAVNAYRQNSAAVQHK